MILTGRQAASKKGTGQWWGVSGSVQAIEFGKFTELVSSHSCFVLGTVWLICDIALLLKSFIMTSECVRNIITQGMTLDERAGPRNNQAIIWKACTFFIFFNRILPSKHQTTSYIQKCCSFLSYIWFLVGVVNVSGRFASCFKHSE